MKRIFSITCVFLLVFTFNKKILADDHSQELPNVANVQVNVCKLKEGVSLKEYNDVTQDYVKWSKKNNVETFYVRHFPLFSHGTTGNPLTYDFLEILGSSHETSG